MFIQLGTDDAQSTGVIGMTSANLMFFGDLVKLDPGAVFAVYDTLGTQNFAVFTGVQRFQDMMDLVLGIGLGRFLAPAGKDLVGMMVVMVMVVAAAGAVRTM